MILCEVPLNTMITLFSENIAEEYIYGFPIAQDEDRIVIACVDDYGEEDGFLILPLEGIYRLDSESACEKWMERTFCLKKQRHQKLLLTKNTLMEDLLQWTYKNKKVITVGFDNGDYNVSGYLENLEEYKIRRIDIYECKPEQGTERIDPQKASYIRVDSRRARDAAKVYQYKGKLDIVR